MLRRITCVLLLALTTSLSAKTYTLGGDRPATLMTPASASATNKVPLIVFLHGYTSNAAQSDSFFGISKQRDQLEFAILLPDGTKNSDGNRFWNATPECCDSDQSKVDDAGYLAGLIREAEATAPIDAERVFLIGHSNGGFMSYRMACDYPELIRGIVSISGAFFRNPALCKNPGPMNILQIHGTTDTTVPFEGSESFPSAQTSLNYWIDKNACDKALTTPAALDLVRSSGSSPTLNETDSQVWNNCREGSQVGLWKINGTGHLPYFNSSWLGYALKFID